MTETHQPLPDHITKLLGDKLYDRRKLGASFLEEMVKEALSDSPGHGGPAQIQKVLECVKRDYLKSPQPNHRKGGLIGLASVAIGLGKELPHFLQELVEPTLALFHDEDPRVRYYACESLYNISKVAGDTVLLHFNPIFDGLSRLYADVDADVKNGVHVLDRLMKDIVTQNPAQFQVAEFIPLLAQRMTALNPFIRQLVLAWIRLLLDLPQVEMVAYVPEYLEGLFNFLGDQARDIKHNADACLQKLQECITSSKDADGLWAQTQVRSTPPCRSGIRFRASRFHPPRTSWIHAHRAQTVAVCGCLHTRRSRGEENCGSVAIATL